MNFSDFKPQQVFLLQGTETLFETILQELDIDGSFVQGAAVPRFTMEDALDIVEFNSESNGTARTYAIYFSVFSPETAQVLLKTLEEPDRDTRIILITPYPYLVPATIRSRAMLIASKATEIPKESFFKNRADALTMIKDQFGGDAEEDAATRRAKAVGVLDILEVQSRGAPEKARAVYHAKSMLFKANMPTKYILEYAATMAL